MSDVKGNGDRPDPAVPDGYRTLIPGNRVPVPAKAEPKPAAKPTTPAAGATPAVPAKPPAQPTAKPPTQTSGEEKPHDDPTRFGDWEVKGRCIDF
ncbi:MAG TPA: DUF1674 domain-containing protein [Alphaproteobacteria bacterium]|jgi:hypothetical protein|nr:DUF1674 domain-containing protein [Alphaproteobacteria bacterium]